MFALPFCLFSSDSVLTCCLSFCLHHKCKLSPILKLKIDEILKVARMLDMGFVKLQARGFNFVIWTFFTFHSLIKLLMKSVALIILSMISYQQFILWYRGPIFSFQYCYPTAVLPDSSLQREGLTWLALRHQPPPGRSNQVNLISRIIKSGLIVG